MFKNLKEAIKKFNEMKDKPKPNMKSKGTLSSTFAFIWFLLFLS